jgi:type I restriction enzyme S subunit
MNFKDMTNCPYLPLPQLLSFIVDNRGKTVPTDDKGIPLIATNCIKNDELYPVFEKIRYLSEETYKTWFRAHPLPGDIIFVNKGTPGKVCFVPEPVNFCIAQDMMAFRANEKIVDNKYLFTVLRSSQIQTQIEQFHVGTLIPHFKKSDLDKILIPVPDIKIQKYIGETYYAFCNKIEINNRINKNLEEIAQAIFKSWFVDFEPFQDGEFEDSELGRIPKGWRVENLDDIANYLNGLAMRKFRPETDESLPVIKIKELNQGCTDENSDRASVNIPEKYIIQNGDVIFSWSGTLAVKIWTGGIGGLNQHLFKVTSENFDKWYYYLWTLKHLEKFKAIAQDKATTMGHIKRGHLTESKVLVPMDTDLDFMNSIMNPIINQMIDSKIQNEALKELRDSLLPKLMSGEIRVPIEEVQ